MTIDEYTREFKAQVQMCKELKSNIGNTIELQKMLCNNEGVRYINMLGAMDPDDKEKWKQIKQMAREPYLVMLHFNGLNQNSYNDLHKGIHKAHQIGGVDTLPKRIDRMIFLAGKIDKENGWIPSAPAPSSAGTCVIPGMAYIQAVDLKEHDRDINVMVMAQHGGGSGEMVMYRGIPIVCLNPKCGGNHYICDCKKTSDQDKVLLLAVAKKKWEVEKVVRTTRQGGTVPGQVHMQVSIEDVKGQGYHQNNYIDALVFI